MIGATKIRAAIQTKAQLGPPGARAVDRPAAMPAIQLDTRTRQAVRFAWHFIQMFLAMMVGMVPLGIVLALLRVSNLSKTQPELFASLMALSMVLPMAAWMLLRMGHSVARTTEMSLAMLLPTVVIVPLCLAGVLPHSAAVGPSMMLMSVAMLADMGFRWRDYAQHRR